MAGSRSTRAFPPTIHSRQSPFASDLDEASAGLTTLAFGGPGICSPCFADGSTGIPLRDEAGELVQGMAGPANPDPGFESDGLIRKRFSADGTHLIFGSTSLFAAGGNDETGDVSIYDRNLETGQTQAVSNDTSGDPLACLQGAGQCHSPANTAGIAELDVSSDGSRILVGQLVDTDAAGNEYFHLYMHIGSNAETVDLTPGTTDRGSLRRDDRRRIDRLFLHPGPLVTTADQDTDSSIDIFRADLSPSATQLSPGSRRVDREPAMSTPATRSRTPPNAHWNVVAGEPPTAARWPIGGGGGVASDSGAIYFLSPEQLDGGEWHAGRAQPLCRTSRAPAPHFVVTLESNLTAPRSAERIPPVHSQLRLRARSLQFIAVDASGGPSDGDIYVADNGSAQVVRKYDPDGNLITSWADNGVLDGSTTAKGPFGTISGVAVGPDGTLYVGVFELIQRRRRALRVRRRRYLRRGARRSKARSSPSGSRSTAPETSSTSATSEASSGSTASNSIEISGNTEGRIRRTDPEERPGRRSEQRRCLSSTSTASHWRSSPSTGSGQVIQNERPTLRTALLPDRDLRRRRSRRARAGSRSIPSNGDLYVDEGNRILRFDFIREAASPGRRRGSAASSTRTGRGRRRWLVCTRTRKVPGGANVAAFGAAHPRSRTAHRQPGDHRCRQ